MTKERKLAGASLANKKVKRVWVWRLKGAERGTVWLFSPALHGFTVHFDAKVKRSSPHYDDGGSCDGCIRELPTKEVFYLYGYHLEKQRAVFLELPRGAAEKLESMLAMGETFRGLTLHVQRTAADNGRLMFRFCEGASDLKKLAEDRSPVESLHAMWGIKQELQGRDFSGPENRVFSRNGAK